MPRSKPKGGSVGKALQMSVTTGTILRVLFIVVLAFLVYYLREIVAIIVAALLLAALIDPAANWLQRKKMPRGMSVALIYSAILAVSAGIGVLVIPQTIAQSSAIVEKYRPFLEEVAGDQPIVQALITGELFERDFMEILRSIQEAGITDALPIITSAVIETFGFFLTILLIFILAFYMVMEEDMLKRDMVQWLTPKKYRSLMTDVVPKMRAKLGTWLRAQLLVMFIIFTLTFIVLSLLGMPFALVLALIAGLLEIVPFLGPMLSAVPAVIIALSVSPIQALFVGIAYFLIQQLEGDVLSPKIMQKVAGLNPIVSILAILIGFQIAGVMGALLALPFTMVVGVFVTEWLAVRENAS